MNLRGCALIVCLGSFALAVSGETGVWDLNGESVDLGYNGVNNIPAEYGGDVLVTNGTFSVGALDAGGQFTRIEVGEGATFNVKEDWQQSTGNGTLVVRDGGTVNFKGSVAKFGFRKGVNNFLVEGGTVNVSSYLGIGYSAFNADGVDVQATFTMNGGTVVTPKMYVGYAEPKTYKKSSKTYYYKAQTYSSVFDLRGGAVTVSETLYVGNGAGGKDYVTGSPDMIRAILGSGELTVGQVTGWTGTADTEVHFNGVTVRTGATVKTPWFNRSGAVNPFMIDDGGVTFDVLSAAQIAVPIRQGEHVDGGPLGTLTKTGPGELSFTEALEFLGPVVCRAGRIRMPVLVASTDFRAEGGVIDLTSSPVSDTPENLSISLAGEGEFIGLDLSLPFAQLKLGPGASLPVTFGVDGCLTPVRAQALVLEATAEAPVQIHARFDGIAGFLRGGTYRIIPSGLTEDDLVKFELKDTAGELVIEDGALIARAGTRPNGEVIWDGAAGTDWWAADQWLFEGASSDYREGDSPVFRTQGAHVVLDAGASALKMRVEASLRLEGEAVLSVPEIEVGEHATATVAVPLSEDLVKTGTGTLELLNVATARPLNLQAGTVRFGWTETPLTNPLSGSVDANAISGTLDLGGTTQTVTSSMDGSDHGFMRTGGALTNGTVTITPTTWWRMNETTFTVKKDATLVISNMGSSSKFGQMGFQRNAQLIVDGGRVEALSSRYGGYLSCDEVSTNVLRVINGGVFRAPNQYFVVGSNGGGRGVLSVDQGTIDLDSREMKVTADAQTVGVVAMTNATLKAGLITFNESESAGPALVTLKDTEVTASSFCLKSSFTVPHTSWIEFDGVTLIDRDTHRSLLGDLGLPYTLGEGGLTIRLGDVTSKLDECRLDGAFMGPGDLVLERAGDNPRLVSFAGGSVNYGLEGNLIVNEGVGVRAIEKFFEGGLVARTGAKLEVETSLFGGDVILEAGVEFPTLDTSVEYRHPVVLVSTTGHISNGCESWKDPNTRNRFSVQNIDGINSLVFGVRYGFMILFR